MNALAHPISNGMKAMEREAHKTSDSELLLLSLRDPSIFSKIVDRYQAPFVRKATSIIGNKEDVQDIVQEAFTKIYLNAQKFELRESAAFSSWAYKILINTCFSYYKKHKRDKSLVSYDDSLASAEARPPLEEESRMERFFLVLSKIPESAARLLRLLVVEGKDYQELAELEGITEDTLRVRVHRAKSNFKKALIQNPHL